MNNDLLLVAFLGFSSGYILRSIIYGWKTFSASARFVQNVGYQLLAFLGTVVYKVSYVDQMCIIVCHLV